MLGLKTEGSLTRQHQNEIHVKGHLQRLTVQRAAAADFDDDGVINVTDTLGILGYLFHHEAPPPVPFPLAGLDPTEDNIECQQ